MSFCRSTAKRIVRSLRRRSDRCHLSWWKEKVNYPTEDRLQQKEKEYLYRETNALFYEQEEFAIW